MYILPLFSFSVFCRKLSFKQYEERKNAAEKIIAEAEQIDIIFKKHKSSIQVPDRRMI